MIPEKYRCDILARTVAEVDTNPSRYEVAVLLEVLGLVNNDDSSGKIFEISEQVKERVPVYSRPEQSSTPAHLTFGKMKALVSAMVYSAVWSIMLIALFAGGISLWAAYPGKVGSIPPLMATAVGLGVIISFVATGGVQQVFALRMSYYKLQDNYPLARTEAARGYAIGFLLITIAAIIFLLFNVVTKVFPLELAAYTIAFLILLGGYRILVIPLYAYRKFSLVAIGLGAALLCLYSVFVWLKQIPIAIDHRVVFAQFAGLVALDVVTAVECIRQVLRRKGSHGLKEAPIQVEPVRNVKPPRLTFVLFEMAPVFVFGTMFYVFLFFDRLLSWISTSGPFLLTYNANYEFGADTALLILIPLTGIIQYFMHRLSDLLEGESAETLLADRDRLRIKVGRFVAKTVASIGLVACLSVFLLWHYAGLIMQMANGNYESVIVFRFGLVAYSIFAIFLALTFVSLSFRRYSVPAVLLCAAPLIELGANALCPGLFSTWNPVYGLLLSVISVTAITAVHTARVVQQSHYSYYSSF